MDRRTFTLLLPAFGLGLAGCGDASGPTATPPPNPPPAPPPPAPPAPPAYLTAADRAFGVVDGLLASVETTPAGDRWSVLGESGPGYRTDLYAGQAGILAFLAEAYRVRPSDALAATLERSARWTLAQPRFASESLYDGNAGIGWALLSVHEALGGTEWLDAAAALAPAVATWRGGLVGDLINGAPGQGLFLLRLHRLSGDDRWLGAARAIGDEMLASAVPAAGGIKFPSFSLQPGVTVFYPGLAHGSAGAGYFLCRLAAALPANEGATYLAAAEAVARWLDAIARPAAGGVNWYRREPDQLDQQQVQWCHGAPGIGIFYAELHARTGDPAHLEMARHAAALVIAEGGDHWSSCLCHGVAGNAGIFLKLHRVTGDPAWLERAKSFAEVVWSRRLSGAAHPAWTAGDGTGTDQPGLLTGTAGVGWLYLQLASDGVLGAPVTD